MNTPGTGSLFMVALYRFQGGMNRGFKRRETSAYSLSTVETVGELIARLISEKGQDDNPNVSFFLRPIGSLPQEWDRSGTVLDAGDRRLVAEVVTTEHCVVMVIPMRPGKSDIGVFVAPSEPVLVAKDIILSAQELPGVEWLQDTEPPARLDPAQVAAVAEMVGGLAALRDPAPLCAGPHRVTAAACDALVAQVDVAWEAEYGGVAMVSGLSTAGTGTAAGASHLMNPLEQSVRTGSRRDDFKLLLAPTALAAAVGSEMYAAIMALLDTLAPGCQQRAPDAIAVRRTEASGRWIGFHTDRAAATVQVPLRSDQAGSGGRLVFLAGDGVAVAPREAGALLGHRGDAVHGVTRLVAGRRYGLFVLRARPGDADLRAGCIACRTHHSSRS